jgi:hypothetical protein
MALMTTLVRVVERAGDNFVRPRGLRCPQGKLGAGRIWRAPPAAGASL